MPVGADGRIVLSFNLLNANPQDWIYDWYGAYYLQIQFALMHSGPYLLGCKIVNTQIKSSILLIFICPVLASDEFGNLPEQQMVLL